VEKFKKKTVLENKNYKSFGKDKYSNISPRLRI
jgi:hypothetical protein